MRLIYLYFEGNSELNPKVAEIDYNVQLPSAKMFTKTVPDAARPSSLRQRDSSLKSSNNLSKSATISNSSSSSNSPIRSDMRRLNNSQKSRGRSGTSSVRNAYSNWENELHTSNIEWESFVNLPMQAVRTNQAIPFNVLNDLRICTSSSSQVVNTTTIVRKGCNDIWADNFIVTWKNRMVNGLCEDNANSKIRCFDSVTKSRFCVFDNAMMNFRKMRKRKQTDGHMGRSWERGFLAADCGDMAPDDIGYLPLYKPDIEGRESAVCDYVFNETVLMYSHENIRNFGTMITDYLNVWTTLWLSGLGRTSRDVSLLHIDGVKRGRYSGDAMNQFFKTYNVSFRRIIRASDFTEKSVSLNRGQPGAGPKVCFKRLIVQPRPVLQFQWDGIDDPSCPIPGASSLFQRWNLQIRNNYGLLSKNDFAGSIEDSGANRGHILQVLLVTRSLRTNPSDASSLSQSQTPAHLIARIFRNQDSLIARFTEYLSSFPSLTTSEGGALRMKLIAQDLTILPFEEQVQLLSESSVVVGMHGAGIASTVHLPIGSPYCCGVVEILPSIAETGGSGAAQISGRGYGHLARKLGHVYERLDLPASATTLPTGLPSINGGGSSTITSNEFGSEVPIDRLLESVGRVLKRIVEGGEASCLLPEVHKTPYF